jgi:hypothetical protein
MTFRAAALLKTSFMSQAGGALRKAGLGGGGGTNEGTRVSKNT